VVVASRCQTGTSETYGRATSAPTGQALTHCPQNSQSSGRSSSVETRASSPRLMTPIAATPCTSSQIRTHFPQMMHFSGSRMITGDLRSGGASCRWKGTWSSGLPYSYTRSCSRQSPRRSQTGHSIR